MNKKSVMIGSAVVLSAGLVFLISRIYIDSGRASHVSGIKIDGGSSSLFREAQKLLSKGDTDIAIENFEMVIARYPDSTQVEPSLLALASIYEERVDLVKAKEFYQKALEKFPNSGNILKAQGAVDNINIKILFSSIATPDSFFYEVQKGDTLWKLAKKFGTTIELIARANSIKDGTIRIGKKLKMARAKFSIVVDKSQNILTLKADDNIVKTYSVSTGKDYSTPAGSFKITIKMVDPTWYTAGAVVPPASPDNILGSRWMGISEPGYGIHGTVDPQSIGKQVTAGCVRMKNQDAEELYAIVPEGTEVVIVD